MKNKTIYVILFIKKTNIILKILSSDLILEFNQNISILPQNERRGQYNTI